ncbi:MAG: DUF3617 domain-containing protein [Blastomonas sp.]
MKKTLVLAVALAPLMALSACGDSGNADSDGDGKISSEEAAEAAKDVKLDPGKWENTVEFVDISFDEAKLPPEARGFASGMLKSMVGQKQTTSSCLTPEEAAKPQADFFAGNKEDDCEYKTFNISGGKMKIDMTCTQKDKSEANISLSGNYSSDSYDMEMNMAMNSPQMGEMTIKAKTNAKRVGECDG